MSRENQAVQTPSLLMQPFPVVCCFGTFAWVTFKDKVFALGPLSRLPKHLWMLERKTISSTTFLKDSHQVSTPSHSSSSHSSSLQHRSAGLSGIVNVGLRYPVEPPQSFHLSILYGFLSSYRSLERAGLVP